MTSTAQQATPLVLPDSVHREAPADFVRWALTQLGMAVQRGEHELVVELPEADQEKFGGKSRLRLAMNGAQIDGQEPFAWDSRFARWLAGRLKQTDRTLHARPRTQPMSVSEITAMLLPAYEVEGGQLHLAGCQLSDHPFLRLSFAPADGEDPIRHIYVAPDGSSVSEELVATLGLDDLEPITKLPPRLDDAALRSLVAAGNRIAAKRSTSRDPAATMGEPLAVTILWVRHAEGRLQFTIGKSSASLPFSSWAKLLKAQAYVGRYSGASAFRLAVTDDGRIDVAEQIGVCEESGRRVLRQELVQCSVTDKRVLPDLTDRCPVSGQPALKREFAQCTVCRQRVSNAVISDGVCTACRSLEKASKDDPRLVWIFTEHPGLDRWGRWRLAETESVYIAEAASVLKRLLIVVEKDSLIVRRLATGGRLGSSWTDAGEAEHADILK